MFGSRKGDRSEPLPTMHDGPPDSEHKSGLCPRCHRLSSFDQVGSLPLTFDGGYVMEREGGRTPTYSERATVLVCRHCHQGTCVLEEQHIGGVSAKTGRLGGTVTWPGFHWWPIPGAEIDNSVPAPIAEVFREAIITLSAGCPRASAVMARRTLEAITADQGYTEGTLASRLSKMKSDYRLHGTLADWADEVRLVGNKGAHFDPMDQVSSIDARQLIAFIRELIGYLYELPAQLTRRRTAKADL